MKFNVNRMDFMKSLQKVQGIVEKRNTMPVLANVFLEAKENQINITATDLEIFIKDKCAADIEKEGTITVNARKLYDIVKELQSDSVDINVGSGEKVTVKSGKSKFNILGMPAKEFPPFPGIDEEKLKKIDNELLKEMIDKTSIAVSTDEVRYNINGYLLLKEKDKTTIVTTDGHRLAIISAPFDDIVEEGKGVILPRKSVVEIKKLIEDGGEETFFAITDKNATIKKDTTIINTRLIDGEFPDYKQVLPKDNDKNVIINRVELLNALKRVSIVSADKIKGVKFTFEKDSLVLNASSPEIGDATEEINIEYGGEKVEIAFNARYFIDVLEVLGEEKIDISLKDSLSSGIIREDKKENYTYIVMPMRLRQLEENAG